MMHCCSLSDVSDRERGQGFATVQGRFQAEMWALGTIHENCEEVNERLRWETWISYDCPWDLAWLEGKFAQFFEGDSAYSKGRLVAKTV